MKSELINPAVPILIILSTVALYWMSLTNTIKSPSVETSIFIAAIVASLFSLLIAFRKIGKANVVKQKAINYYRVNRSFLGLAITLSLAGNALFLYQHILFYNSYGLPPILLPDFETLRINFAINGYIHLIAVMSGVHLLIIRFHCLYARNVNRALPIYFWISSIVYIVMCSLIGSRGLFFQSLFILFGLQLINYKINVLKIVCIAALALYLLGAMKMYRDYAFYGDSIFEVISIDWSFGDNLLFSPLYYTYLTFASNFDILNLYVNEIKNYSYGYFTLYSPIASIFTDVVDIKSFQESILGISFHGGLTATGYGLPYIDYGPLGVLLPLFWLAAIMYLWDKIKKESNLRYAPLYIYIFMQASIMFYTYTFSQFYVILNVFYLIFASIFTRRQG